MSADLPLCRWTAIKIHNIMGLLLCGALIPFSFGIQAVTYSMSPKVPDKSGKLQVSGITIQRRSIVTVGCVCRSACFI